MTSKSKRTLQDHGGTTDMNDNSSVKAYWSLLLSKRYWLEVQFGLPPKDPWAPTNDMRLYQVDRVKPLDVSQTPKSLDMVVALNRTFLEVAEGRYTRRGFGGMVYSLLLAPLLCAGGIVLWFVFSGKASIGWSLLLLLEFLVIEVPLLWLIGYHWKQEMWDYTYKPTRLVRATRKVHVFQHNGPGGVWSMDWDKMVFCLKKGGLNWGLMGYMPDERGQVTRAFYLGAIVPGNSDGSGAYEPLQAHWEYFRRYMDDEEESVPLPEVILPIGDRREPFLFGVKQLGRMFGPLALLFAPLTTLASVFRWIGMRLSRMPRWSEEVEAQCQIAPDDTTDQLIPRRVRNPVEVAVGVMFMLAVDAVLLWLLCTHVFHVERIFNH